MTLTVPTAGVIAGRAPQGVQVAVPELGANLNALGQKMGEIATRWQDEDRQLQAQRTTLDMTREFALARQQVDQLTDPAAVGPAWDAATAEIRAKYLPADGSLDPKLETQLGLNFTELNDRNNLAVGDRMIALRNSAQTGNWIELSSKIAAEAVTADATNFQAMVDLGHNAIEGRLAGGIIDPAAAAAEQLAFDKDVYGARASGLIDQDPAGFLAAVEAGEFTELGDSLKVYSGAAKNAVAQQATAATSAQKQANEATAKRLGSMTDLFRDGRKVEDVAYLNDAGVVAQAAVDPKLNDARNEALAAQDLADEMPAIRTMTLAQIDAQIVAEKKRPVDSTRPWEAKRLDVLIAWRDQAAAKWQSDPVATARAAGLPVPELPNFDPSRPDEFSAGLAGRMNLGTVLKGADLTTAPAILSNDEKAALQPVIKPEAEVGPKLALAAATVAGGGDDWQRAAQAMDASPELTGAMRLLSETGDTALAETILRGQQKVATGVASLPPASQLQLVFSEITGGVFDKDTATAEMLLKSAAAVYADDAGNIDPNSSTTSVTLTSFSSDSEKITRFKDALARVMGATLDAGDKLTVGGLQEVNGGPVVLPAGMPVAAVTAAWDSVGVGMPFGAPDMKVPDLPDATMGIFGPGIFVGEAAAEVSKMFGKGPLPQGFEAKHPEAFPALMAASVDGKSVPDFKGDPSKWWPLARPVAMPGQKGMYYLRIMVDGRPQPLWSAQDPTKLYIFRMTDLVREAGQ